MCKLTIIQIIIEPFLCQQFLMISLLNDRTIFHHQNPVCILNRGQSMCHDKAGAPFHQFCKCILNLDLRSGINGRCRLIQNQHRRLAQTLPAQWRINCFCPWDRLPPSSPITVSYPSDRRLINPCAWHAFAAAITSSSVASGLPMQILFTNGTCL